MTTKKTLTVVAIQAVAIILTSFLTTGREAKAESCRERYASGLCIDRVWVAACQYWAYCKAHRLTRCSVYDCSQLDTGVRAAEASCIACLCPPLWNGEIDWGCHIEAMRTCKGNKNDACESLAPAGSGTEPDPGVDLHPIPPLDLGPLG
jgi:hypothetical protein